MWLRELVAAGNGSFFSRPLADSEKLPVQRHRNVEALKSPDSEAPLVEKKSKKPKKKEKKHKDKERDKGKKKEKEKKVVEEEEEEVKKVIVQDLHYFSSCCYLLLSSFCCLGTVAFNSSNSSMHSPSISFNFYYCSSRYLKISVNKNNTYLASLVSRIWFTAAYTADLPELTWKLSLLIFCLFSRWGTP